jgi:signal transduction histidine kinase
MLHDFLAAHRETIVSRARARMAPCPAGLAAEEEHSLGVSLFLDQLVEALQLAKTSQTTDYPSLAASSGRRGLDLLREGFTIAQVVHDYGVVFETIVQLSLEIGPPLSGDDHLALDRCHCVAVAEAVSQYARRHERAIADEGTERLGVLAHELRNLLSTATLSFESIQSGRIAPAGSTARVLGRSLVGLRQLIDRSLADVRLDAGLEHIERVAVADLLREIESGSRLQAESREIRLVIGDFDDDVEVEIDRPSIAGALTNLLQNAFKFTRRNGIVTLNTRSRADRVLYEVEDQCGGLPPGKVEDLFRPFEQRGHDRTGVGLGLAISLRAAKANGGELRARDLPGVGCTFTLDLPERPREHRVERSSP